jgi:CDGSH-type Zn-finger protein
VTGEPVVITIRPRGTIVVQGPVTILDPEGRELESPPAKHPGVIKLCGCGRSATRPFCDGTHNQPAPGAAP